MNNFDQLVGESLTLAQLEAQKLGHHEIFPLHLFYGLLSHPETFIAKHFATYLALVKSELAKLPKSTSKLSLEQIKPHSDLSLWLTKASGRAITDKRKEISEIDLLPFLLEMVPSIPFQVGDIETLKKSSEAFSSSKEKMDPPPFLINLSKLAEEGKLDPVIGRTKEIRAVLEVLGRRNKNNPVLVGGAGVGKTAIIEGLADLIFKDKVPERLKGKTIYSLNMGQLMAGTKYRGEFEEKIVQLLKFIKEGAGEIILFIDEIHLLVGAGKSDGAIDAANLLKPALARGELHCIGATTPAEFQKYILSDLALERRFRSIPVLEPSKEESILILMGIKDKLEIHHGIKISDDAIYKAVYLSDQYMSDKNLPDKAIDLIDEAASAMKLTAETIPAELESLGALISSKKILSEVEKENHSIKEEIKVLEEKYGKRKKEHEKEMQNLLKVTALKKELDRLKFDLETMERKQNYEKASELKYSVIPNLEKEIEIYGNSQILEQIEVAKVISRQTGIPLEKIMKSKQEKILDLESHLNQRVFGQQKALHAISEILITSHAGLTDSSRPLGSFLLLGPTGVGKTETVKAVSEFIFGDEKSILRFDLSEYSEKHSVAKLIGAPAGYIGYDEGGILTSSVMKRPYSVILFDEIEKAHSDFADILLQILDDGRLTDNKGNSVNFKNTIIFMTSNSRHYEIDFKKEVLGRIDEIITYEHLRPEIMKELIQKQITLLIERLKGKQMNITLSPALMTFLEENGYDETYGARPLQSLFNKSVIRPLAEIIVKGENAPQVILDYDKVLEKTVCKIESKII